MVHEWYGGADMARNLAQFEFSLLVPATCL